MSEKFYPCRSGCRRGSIVPPEKTGDETDKNPTGPTLQEFGVCLCCGGLGVQSDAPAFRRRIYELRQLIGRGLLFLTDLRGEPLRNTPVITSAALHKGIAAIGRHWEESGKPVDCYAFDLTRGRLAEAANNLLAAMKAKAAMAADKATADWLCRRVPHESLTHGVQLTLRGDLEAGEAALLEAYGKTRGNAGVAHFMAEFYGTFRQDLRSVETYLREAAILEPKAAVRHWDLHICLTRLGHHHEAGLALADALACPDAASVPGLAAFQEPTETEALAALMPRPNRKLN
jgi:hypothetical protein